MIPLAEEIIRNESYSLNDLKAQKEKLAKKKSRVRNQVRDGIGDAASDYVNEIMPTKNLTK